MRIEQEQINAVELDAVHLRASGQVEHRIKVNRRLGALAAYTAVQALSGKDVPAFVKVPLPVIDNSTIDSYLARADKFPADGYIFSPYDQALFDKLLAQK